MGADFGIFLPKNNNLIWLHWCCSPAAQARVRAREDELGVKSVPCATLALKMVRTYTSRRSDLTSSRQNRETIEGSLRTRSRPPFFFS